MFAGMSLTDPGELPSLSDGQLVDLALENRERAYRELMARHQPAALRLIGRMVDNPATAEDLCQEVFAKVFAALKTWSRESKFSSWILRIAYNHTANYLSEHHSLPARPIDGSPWSTTERILNSPIQVGDRQRTPLQEVERAERERVLEQAMALLRPKYRTCIQLCFEEDKSYKEAAEIMGVPESTIATYIRRARMELVLALKAARV